MFGGVRSGAPLFEKCGKLYKQFTKRLYNQAATKKNRGFCIMKTKTNKIFCILIIMALTLSLLISGCSFQVGGGQSGTAGEHTIKSVSVDGSGNVILTLDDGSNVRMSSSDYISEGDKTVNNTSITIEGAEGMTDVVYASSKALLSAVSVYCTFTRTVTYTTGGFGFFFGGGTTQTQDQTYQSAGSGVIYKLDKEAGEAYILTNYHVVYDNNSNTQDHISDSITVYLYGSEMNGKGIKATYVGGSMYYDIAVLKISNSEILRSSAAVPATIGDSNKIVAGQTAIAVGNPEAAGISVTSGVVSVPSEYISMTGADGSTTVAFRVIRIDTAVNSGNSGGGLYNDKGELIGIVNAKTASSSVENIAYAIPTSVVRAIAENVLYYCDGENVKTVQRGYLGVTVAKTDSRAVVNTETGTVSIEETIAIDSVTAGGLAEGVLQSGDVLISLTVRGTTTMITRQYHLVDSLLDARPGDTVTLRVRRNGEEMDLNMTITEENIVSY